MNNNDFEQLATRKFWRATAKWTIIFAFVLALLFAFLWWNAKQTNAQFAQKGVKTQGVVQHAECNGSGNCQNVQVSYKAGGINKTLITHTDSFKPVTEGQVIDLRYLKDNPLKAQLTNQGNDENLWLFLLGLMGVLVVAGIVVRIILSPDPAHASAPS